MQERLEMKRFLKFLKEGDFIEIESKRGIWTIIEAGKPVKRSDISVIAKLTPKGLGLLNEEKNSFYNKFGIISAFLISAFSLCYSYFESQNSKQLENELNRLYDNVEKLNTDLGTQKDLIIKYQRVNERLETDIKRIESKLKTE